jgi:hypothetical protein
MGQLIKCTCYGFQKVISVITILHHEHRCPSASDRPTIQLISARFTTEGQTSLAYVETEIARK